jgi:hypothetical protein
MRDSTLIPGVYQQLVERHAMLLLLGPSPIGLFGTCAALGAAYGAAVNELGVDIANCEIIAEMFTFGSFWSCWTPFI